MWKERGGRKKILLINSEFTLYNLQGVRRWAAPDTLAVRSSAGVSRSAIPDMAIRIYSYGSGLILAYCEVMTNIKLNDTADTSKRKRECCKILCAQKLKSNERMLPVPCERHIL